MAPVDDCANNITNMGVLAEPLFAFEPSPMTLGACANHATVGQESFRNQEAGPNLWLRGGGRTSIAEHTKKRMMQAEASLPLLRRTTDERKRHRIRASLADATSRMLNSRETLLTWDEKKRQRFQELRQPQRQLNPAEQAELACLIQELEAAEAAYLRPATEALRQESELTQKQNEQLDQLIQRKQALAERLLTVLNEVRAERQAIESDLASVLATGHETDAED